jgi:small subunit ribosomal protein S18
MAEVNNEVVSTEVVEEKKEERVKKFRKQTSKRKVCVFCVDKTKSIDYKDVSKLRRFVTENGKILPRRQTGTCALHQRELAQAIKRARIMALVAFKGE